MSQVRRKDVQRQRPRPQHKKIDSRPFGDNINSKSKEIIRVMFQNVRGFGYKKEQPKTDSIRKLVQNNKVDIFGMSEINIHWKLTARKNSIQDVARYWFERSKVSVAQNMHYKGRKKHQPGGVSVISQGHLALRTGKSKNDVRGLGRWSSQLFQGKGNLRTRVVSVYVPIVTKYHGHKKVFCQQQNALLNMKVPGQVITTFWKDFWQQIDEWLEAGEQLVIGGDWNADVTKKWTKEFTKRLLLPVVTGKHKDNIPSTHNNGSYAIDEIFASATLGVKSAGFLEFGYSKSDHRPIWVDFTKESFLGCKLPKLEGFSARRLKTTDPRVVQKYNKTLEAELKKHGVYHRTHRLLMNFSSPLTKQQIKELEKLDRTRIAAMRKAERRCRKLKMGKVKWSPELQEVRDKIHYLRLCISRKTGRKVGARLLIRLSKKVQFNTACWSMKELKDRLDAEYKNYKALKKKAGELRQAHMESLAEALEKKTKVKKAAIIKQLIEREQKRDMFRKLKWINKKLQNLSTSFVTVKNPDGTRKDITDKIQMQEAINLENKIKMHQTEATCPFKQKPLREHFGDVGHGKSTEEVMDGSFQCPDMVSDATKEYLQQCQLNPDTMTQIPRSVEDFKQSWEKAKEATSSRSIHFGHFKAATSHSLNLLLHYALAEIPFRSGYSLKRWKKATDVMILKKEGITDIERLRTIVLMEADFNHNNKFFGRQMMHHGVLNDLLAKEQYSIPGKKCIDHVINRRLLFDLIRYQKTSASMASVDLKSCYDRISHAPAYLAMRGFGMPHEPIYSMFNTIQQMKHRNKTVHGVSDCSFGGKQDKFIAKPNGVCQGNGAGPAVWAVVSSKMFQVLHAQGLASKLIRPVSKQTLELCGFAFVDDSDIIAVSNNMNNPTKSLLDIQKVLDKWEAVAKSTGGAIEPSKCWSYLMYFEWNKGSWKYGENSKAKLWSYDSANQRKEIQSISSSTAEKMLGVFLSPDGNDDAQIAYMKDKAVRLGEFIRTGHVQKHEAWIAMTAMALKSIEYPLPALNLSEETMISIMWPILKNFLPKSGLNRYIKRSVLYGSATRQGLGLKNPFLTQGIQHVNDLIENLWKETITGHLMKSNLEQLRIEIGSNVDIFMTNIKEFQPLLLTNSWMRATWEFCSEHGITLDDKTIKIPLWRENDIAIMEAFRNNPAIRKEEWATLNKCRIFLKAFSLADISTGDGMFISKQAWAGLASTSFRDATQWPIWGKPTRSEWAQWQRAISLTFLESNGKKLKKPLLKWIETPCATWMTDKDGSSLWQQLPNKEEWRQFDRVNKSKRQARFSLIGKPVSKPDIELLPTTVYKDSSFLYSEGTAHSVQSQGKQDQQAEETKHHAWLLKDVKFTGPISSIIDGIKNKSLMAVSDGSYKENLGTAAWIIETEKQDATVSGVAVSPGNGKIQSAYRSELLGLLASIEMIEIMAKKFEIKEGGYTLACDGKSALKKAIDAHPNWQSPKQQHADLLSAIATLTANSPLTISPLHVKGHQDDILPFNMLTRPAQLNVICDYNAKQEMRNISQDSENNSHSHHPLSFHPVYYKGKLLHENISKTLYQLFSDDKLDSTWIEKERFPSACKDKIDWDVQAKALSAAPLKTRRFVCKWVSNTISTGANMVKWQLRYKGSCPFCDKDKEDRNHILRCPHPEAQKIWSEGLASLKTSMNKSKTDPRLCKFIIEELSSWHQRKVPPIDQYPTQYKQAILEQRNIGWKNFLEGLISKSIIQIQQQYLSKKSSKTSAQSWAKKIIRKSWKTLRNSWDKRNEKLHSPNIITKLEGYDKLKEAITQEWHLGLNNLPVMEFSHLFNKYHTPQVTCKSLDQMKSWFSTIRSGRILYQDTIINDEFSTKGPLQRWAGLSNDLFPSKRESKTRIKLNRAIRMELDRGLGQLPPASYSQFFRQSHKQITNLPIKPRKDWFLTVRKARMLYEKENLIEDDFSKLGHCQRWVGLEYSLFL